MAGSWQWIKRCLFTRKSNQVFNRFIRIKSLWLSDVVVTGNIGALGANNNNNNNNTNITFKNCAPFR